jgi:HTH-type transcriptional regulator / antitoxin HipB
MEQFVHSPKSLGSVIKRRRKAKKLTQEEAGSAFKIEQSTVSSIEQGTPGTRIETLFRILAALDLEMVIQQKKTIKPKSKVKEGW